MIRIFSVILFSLSIQCFAEPVGEIRFIAKVQSIDAKWVNITVGGKSYQVPRDSIAEDISPNTKRQIALSVNEFNDMKLRSYIAASNNKK